MNVILEWVNKESFYDNCYVLHLPKALSKDLSMLLSYISNSSLPVAAENSLIRILQTLLPIP